MAVVEPRLTFFCELEPGPLRALFADSTVIEDLAALQASLILGVLDLSPERAAVVARLNEAGIPVIGWQPLPKEQGYCGSTSGTPPRRARAIWSSGPGRLSTDCDGRAWAWISSPTSARSSGC